MHERAKRITWTIAIALAVLSGGCHAGRGPSPDVRTAEPRVDLEMITGRVWVLDAWREGEPATAEPEVSLRYAAGSLTGRAGCNRYTAPVERRPGLGSIAVGAIAATRMMCPPPIVAVESRFLEALARTKAIELQDKKLSLVYATADGREAKLSFRPQ
jgi:heat shock protein HslJ